MQGERDGHARLAPTPAKVRATLRTLTDVNGELAARDNWLTHYVRGAACGVYVMTLATGFALGASKGGVIELLCTLGVAWAITLFCALDARARARPFPMGVWRICFLMWPFAPLFHFVSTRGKKGVLTYALHAALLLFCLLTSTAIGSLIR